MENKNRKLKKLENVSNTHTVQGTEHVKQWTHTHVMYVCVVLHCIDVFFLISVASRRHSCGSYSRWHPVTSTISSVTSMRQRRHLPPLPHIQLTVNKTFKSKAVVSEGSSWYVTDNVLHLCETQLIMSCWEPSWPSSPTSCCGSLPPVWYCTHHSSFFDCSCVDSHTPWSFGALSVNHYNACRAWLKIYGQQ